MRLVINTPRGTFFGSDDATEDGFNMLLQCVCIHNPDTTFEMVTRNGTRVMFPMSVLKESIIYLLKD